MVTVVGRTVVQSSARVWLLARRWIERINAKLREKPKKEEVKRLKAFVEAAFQQDPRMMQRRAAEKAEKCASALLRPSSCGSSQYC